MSTTSIRPPSHSLRPSQLHQQPNSALQARINQKRQELDSLIQLRDLSVNLTAQLERLETKLGQLNDGAQSVALVLANWENVLGVIRMAGMRAGDVVAGQADSGAGDGGKAEADPAIVGKEEGKEEQVLPVPLVRIPVQTKEGGGG